MTFIIQIVWDCGNSSNKIQIAQALSARKGENHWSQAASISKQGLSRSRRTVSNADRSSRFENATRVFCHVSQTNVRLRRKRVHDATELPGSNCGGGRSSWDCPFHAGGSLTAVRGLIFFRDYAGDYIRVDKQKGMARSYGRRSFQVKDTPCPAVCRGRKRLNE